MLVSIQSLWDRFGDKLQVLGDRFRVYHEGKVVYLGHLAAENSVELSPEGMELLKPSTSSDPNDELSLLE